MFEPNKAKLVAQVAGSLLANKLFGDKLIVEEAIRVALQIVNEAKKQVEEEHETDV